jgi:hypothetical protein
MLNEPIGQSSERQAALAAAAYDLSRKLGLGSGKNKEEARRRRAVPAHDDAMLEQP